MEQTLNPSPISFSNDTIVAISTPPGSGGIAVIRLSGPDALEIVTPAWRGNILSGCNTHTAHLGKIVDESGHTLDEVVITLFLSPNSYTGEDTVEISCHGSKWIQREIVNLLIRNGARAAGPGEFTQRAFLNGKIDLAQAEGIVDLIASNSRAAQRLAMMQANGMFSEKMENLRHQLIDFASLLELELDFSEEDVEFADRLRLKELADQIIRELDRLVDSYAIGKAFKEGIPVVLAGKPNAGKSTLLNSILEEEKAIVSNIPGTTRDIIEDTREINGTLFRFIDTAGLHETHDIVEQIGIDRATKQLGKAAIVIWLVDTTENITSQLQTIEEKQGVIGNDTIQYILYNKIDHPDASYENLPYTPEYITQDLKISVIKKNGTEELIKLLDETAQRMHEDKNSIMVTNARHYEALIKGRESLQRARALLDNNLSADFIAQDVREALHHLGEITGSITTSTLLQSIFSRFCIGK